MSELGCTMVERPSLCHRSFSSFLTQPINDEPKSLPSFIRLPIAPALFDASVRASSSPAQSSQSGQSNSQPTNQSHSLDVSPEQQQAFGERFHPYEKHIPYIKPKVKCSQPVSGVREVTCDTVAELLKNPMKLDECGFDRLLIVDCRYEYEYTGGHIIGAVNAPHQSSVRSAVFDTLSSHELNDRTLIIMHCELSRHRGPRGLKLLRKHDRDMIGPDRFPELYLPQLYLMSGGFREFFRLHPDLCTPHSYVSMDDPAYSEQLKEVRRQHRQTKLPPTRPTNQSTIQSKLFSPLSQCSLNFIPMGPLVRARSALTSSELCQMRLNEAFSPTMTPSTPSTPSSPILSSILLID